jgi:hypothetical protein
LASFSRKASTLEVVLLISVFSKHSETCDCDSPVVGTDLETLVVHVEDQVLTLFGERRGMVQGEREKIGSRMDE